MQTEYNDLSPYTGPTIEEALEEEFDEWADHLATQSLLGVVSPAEKPTRPEDQQLPSANNLPSMHDKATEDLQSRKELGARRYGVALQPSNGRDAARDLYEECLDAAAYGAQVVWEQEHPKETWVGDLIENMLWLLNHTEVDPEIARRVDFTSGKFIPPAVIALLERHGFVVSIEE